VPVVLEGPKRIQDDEVADVQVRRGGVEPELDSEPFTTGEASFQVLRDMDLNRPLLQALEEPGHLGY
jgi:hypothetical protein